MHLLAFNNEKSKNYVLNVRFEEAVKELTVAKQIFEDDKSMLFLLKGYLL